MISNGFWPKDANGNNVYDLKIDQFTSASSIYKFITHIWPFISFGISTFSGAFGIGKFFLSGPMPLVSKNKPFSGMGSIQFVVIVMLSSMYTVRMIAMEETFFSRFTLVNYLSDRGAGVIENRIDPILPATTRIITYLFPAIFSIIINLIAMCYTSSIKITLSLMIDYPQFLLSPGFAPFLFKWKN